MLNQEVYYVYEIKDSNVHSNNRCLIRSKIKPDDMKNLIFYIQYKYHSIIPQSVLTKDEIKKLLMKCYEAANVDYANIDNIINLQNNFKNYFNKEKGKIIIDNFSTYEVKGLIGELREIVCLTIEMWR